MNQEEYLFLRKNGNPSEPYVIQLTELNQTIAEDPLKNTAKYIFQYFNNFLSMPNNLFLKVKRSNANLKHVFLQV